MGDADASSPVVAVAIPAFNEAEGLPEFIMEIDEVLAPACRRVELIVVDDASTDETVARLRALAPELRAGLHLLANDHNRGHGPTLLRAYRAALAHAPDHVLQVDGDGQFAGTDLRRVLVLLQDGAGAVCGVRRFRQDPWFRMAMTRLLRVYVRRGFGVRARDPNCPLRGYERRLLEQLLADVPEGSLVPNLYLTVVSDRRGGPSVEVDVSHRVRRGASASGTSWGRTRRFSPVPLRLLRFSWAALLESRRFGRRLGRTSGLPLPEQGRPAREGDR